MKYPSLYPSVYPSICVFFFEGPFRRLFAPTSQNQMSKNFRASEYMKKSNEKNWSHIWKLLLIKGVKLLQKISFLGKFCLLPCLPSLGKFCLPPCLPGQILPYWAGFFGIFATIHIGWEILCLLSAGFLLCKRIRIFKVCKLALKFGALKISECNICFGVKLSILSLLYTITLCILNRHILILAGTTRKDFNIFNQIKILKKYFL